MIRLKSQKLTLKYAIGEIILIFIGITVAIWFNNWNEARKLKKVEINTLIELKKAFQQDHADIKDNIKGYASRAELYESIIYHLENKIPFNDTLQQELQYMRGITTFLPTMGPYETLKSRGLELISNNELRLKISKIYEYQYTRIVNAESLHHQHRLDYLKPEIIDKLDLSKKLQPLDYKALKNDFKFKQIIYWALLINQDLANAYKWIASEVELLIKDLETEINRL